MWVAEHHYLVLGTRFCVRSDDHEAAMEVDRLLAPFRSDDLRPVRAKNLFVLASRRPGDDRRHAFRDCRRIARGETWEAVFDPLLGEFNRRAVEEMDYFGVHAGVVALGNRTIAFPGDSGAGKTTLVAACLQVGFGYVSDEALCIDYETAGVVSYPKALNLSRWSLETLALARDDNVTTKMPVAPEEFGSTAAKSPRRLTDVVMLERRPGPPSLLHLPTSQVVAVLVEASFNHYKRPAETYTLINSVASATRAWSLGYEDPKEAARLLFTTFG